MRGMRSGLAMAVVAAVAMMAFGAGSASATVKLCKVSAMTCPAGSIYPSGSQFKAVGNAEFASKKCELEMAFQTTAVSGTQLPAEITAFPFSNCPSGVSITGLNLNLFWSFLIGSSGAPNGFGEIFQHGSTNPVELKVVGLGSTACIYELPHFEPDINGGSWIFTSMTAHLHSGTGCPTAPVFGFEIEPVPAFYVTA